MAKSRRDVPSQNSIPATLHRKIGRFCIYKPHLAVNWFVTGFFDREYAEWDAPPLKRQYFRQNESLRKTRPSANDITEARFGPAHWSKLWTRYGLRQGARPAGLRPSGLRLCQSLVHKVDSLSVPSRP